MPTFDEMQDAYGDAINSRLEALADELETIIQDACEYVRPHEADRIAALFPHYADSAWNSAHKDDAIKAARAKIAEIDAE
jgi:hypothetical protein